MNQDLSSSILPETEKATRRPSNSSHYTSRSIVSLSGLSVSDPLPGSYETNEIDHRRRASSVTSNQGYEEEEDDDQIPTTTFRYNPKMVWIDRFLISHCYSSLTVP